MATAGKQIGAGALGARVLGGGTVRPEELRDLLGRGGREEMEELRSAARAVTAAHHGRTIRLFAPLYFSSACVNDCAYCGFRSGQREVARVTLTPAEIEEEARALLRQGHRRVLLVASEDPTPAGRRLVVDAIRAVSAARWQGARVAQVSAEVAPGDGSFFCGIAAAGLARYLVFQETYDRARYRALHPRGPKSDYAYRRDAPARALAAGIPEVGMGILLGVADPVADLLELIAHAREIERTTARPPRTVSLPRIEPACGSEISIAPPFPVGDSLMLRLIAATRLALPRTGIVLSARETAPFREEALGFGVTDLSAGSRTDPGGYAVRPEGALEQCLLSDRRPLEEVATWLRSLGWEPDRGEDAALALS